MNVEALLEERRGYVLRNLPDRVAQVDAEIERISGLKVEDEPATVPNVDPNSSADNGGAPAADEPASVETADADPDEDLETPETKPARTRGR